MGRRWRRLMLLPFRLGLLLRLLRHLLRLLLRLRRLALGSLFGLLLCLLRGLLALLAARGRRLVLFGLGRLMALFPLPDRGGGLLAELFALGVFAGFALGGRHADGLHHGLHRVLTRRDHRHGHVRRLGRRGAVVRQDRRAQGHAHRTDDERRNDLQSHGHILRI